MERFFVYEPFIKSSVFAYIEALVRRVHHNGVVAKSILFQIVKQSAHVVVNRTYHGNIVAYVVLILPLHQSTKKIVNNVFHRKGQKDKEEGKIYNVAPIFKIKDFSKFLEIFCKEYKVDNPYKSYKIEDF